MALSTISRRRGIIVFCGLVALFLILLVNLFSMQILHRDFFLRLAQDQHQTTVTTYPQRAAILDRHGRPVTVNRDSVAAFILPQQLKAPQQLKQFLRKHFPAALDRLNSQRYKYFMYIQRRLTPAQLRLLKQVNLADIKLVNEPSRFYLVEALGPVLGATNIDNQGIFGLERIFNQRLAGAPAVLALEKEARSGHFYFAKETAQAGQLGQPIQLTIDSDLQFLTAHELQMTVEKFQAAEAAAVILEPHSGHILALVSYPSFNPNQPEQLDLALTKNRPVSEAHELGSVMKPFVALAALEEGVVTPDELIDCGGKKEVLIDGMRVSTVLADGVIPFWKVLTRSNNIGMVKVAQRLGPKLYDYYRKFGFGRKTALNLEGEQAGFVSHPRQWSKRSIVSLSFGYEVSATLLQLACAMGAVANHGYLVLPILLLDPLSRQPALLRRVLSEKTVQQMRQILRENVQAGTGQRANIQGYEIFGKTGTANLLINGKYSKQHNIYSFVGWVERGDYLRVIAVYVKDSPQAGLLASMVAAPLFEQIAEKMIIHDRLLN